MKAIHPGAAARSVRRLAIISAAAVLLVAETLTGSANADGTYRWQNQFRGYWLEIYHASRADGGAVIAYPRHRRTNRRNQLWKDTKLSDGYYRIRNVNSGRSLDRWNRTGPGGDYQARCDVTQYRWWGGAQQRWRYRTAWSSVLGRRFSLWINKAGCQGNPYHDVLGTVYRYANVYLYSEDWCTEHVAIAKSECYWRRNGR